MNQDTIIHLGIYAGGWVALVTTLRVSLRDLTRRVGELENCEKTLAQRYVPREEMTRWMEGIKSTVDQTNSLLKFALRRTKTTV